MLQLTEDLLKKEPEQLAKRFIEVNKPKENKETNGKKPKKEAGISSTQIRRFYDDLLLLQKKARIKQDNKTGKIDEVFFKNRILPLVRMAEARIAYSVGRGVLNKLFYDEMSVYLNKIESEEDLENFMLFYQAIIAYLKYEEAINTGKNNTNSNNKNYNYNDSNRGNKWGGFTK